MHYTLAASLILPTTLSFIPEAQARTTPIDELPASSTTTNVASNHAELERLLDIRLLNRENSFELHFNRRNNPTITIENIKNHIENYINDAMNFKEAEPYVGWSIKDYTIEGINNTDKLTFVIKPTYFTTLNQEREVDRKVKEISREIIKVGMTDFDKTLAIFEYITAQKTLTRDGTTTEPQSTYTLLQQDKGTSRAFALLTFRLLEENNINSRIMTGSILGDLSNDLDVDHFWNLVRLNGQWYHLDSALGAGYTGQIEKFPYQYFLLSDQTLDATHNWIGRGTPAATNTMYERYRYWKKIQFSPAHLVYINGFDLRDELGIDNTIMAGHRIKDFVYDEVNDWIYFIGKSYGNFLYKMRSDGTRFEIVSRERGKSLKIEEIKNSSSTPSTYRLHYEYASGGTTSWDLEPQIEVNRREAKEVDEMIMRISGSNPTVQDVAEVRAKYNLLPIDARPFISMAASLRWASAQAALTTAQNQSANIAVQIAMLEELKPSFRVDVEAARNAYDNLSTAQKRDVYNYEELKHAEQKVQNNLSLAYQLDQDIKALDVDVTKYQDNVLRYVERFDNLTFAQQVLVVQDDELFNKKREVLAHIAVAADFDYRVEMLEETDERFVEKVRALRTLYDQIHVVQDRNIKRYNRLINLERLINNLNTNSEQWRTNITTLFAHYTDVINGASTPPTVIRDNFVQNLINYREAYENLKPTEQQLLSTFEANLTTMENWASQIFRTADVIAIEREIEKLSIDLKEIEKRMDPVLVAYYALSSNEQLTVSNYKKLLDLENWVQYKIDIEKVIKMIEAINRNNSWAKYKSTTYEARFAYDALSEYAKSKIHNYNKLKDAEKDIEKNNGGNVIGGDKPTTPNRDNVVIIGEEKPDGYQFEVDNAILTQTISPDGTRDLILKTNDGFKMTLNAENFNHRFARLSEMTVNIRKIKDYMIDVQLLLHTGTQKKDVIDLTSFVQMEVPTDWLTDDTYNMVIVRSNDNEFTATPFYENGSIITLNTRSLGQFFIRHEDITFNDVRANEFEEAIYFLANRQIVKGTTPFTYSPKNNVTRAQFALMVARALNVKATEQSQFVDARNTYFEEAVQALQQFSIINGVTPDYFRPHQSLTRQQGLLMMGRLLEAVGYTLDDDGFEPYLNDWNLLDPEAQRIYIALEHLELINIENNTFYPHRNLSREEMAKMLMLTLQEAKFY